MLCAKRIQLQSGVLVPCGQCMNCRVNQQRRKMGRLLLEAATHGDSAFVTMTYDPELIPVDDEMRHVLLPVDNQRFLKRLRKRIGPYRYFMCGEYGDGGRPHYHGIVFGKHAAELHTKKWNSRRRQYDNSGPLVEAWKAGFVDSGYCDERTMRYVTGYVTKKMTRKDDQWLKGRPPEFTRQSLRPALGRQAALSLADDWAQDGGLKSEQDVPKVFRLNGKTWPFDRYLRSEMRSHLGLESWRIDESEPTQEEIDHAIEVNEKMWLLHDRQRRQKAAR